MIERQTRVATPSSFDTANYKTGSPIRPGHPSKDLSDRWIHRFRTRKQQVDGELLLPVPRACQKHGPVMGTPGHSGTSVRAGRRPTRLVVGDLQAGGPGFDSPCLHTGNGQVRGTNSDLAVSNLGDAEPNVPSTCHYTARSVASAIPSPSWSCSELGSSVASSVASMSRSRASAIARSAPELACW